VPVSSQLQSGDEELWCRAAVPRTLSLTTTISNCLDCQVLHEPECEMIIALAGIGTDRRV
jgi:hypothetical protein